jgi:putative flavoprotein involved in K+ transport
MHDVVVVGAGQAGLALGYHLRGRGLDYVLLDGAELIGDSWRNRWHSLTLFTPAWYSGLPGLPFPGDPTRYPRKEEVAAYLEAYAGTFSLPVRSRTRVGMVTPDEGGFRIAAQGEALRARQVVVATGPFQEPVRPAWGEALPPAVFHLHSGEYRGPEQLPDGDVLVVGAGNSGVQIAEELAATRRVGLAVGGRLPYLPQRILGRDIFRWMHDLRLTEVTVHSRLGRRMSRMDPLIGTSLGALARRAGVEPLPRAVGAAGDGIRLAGGRIVRPRSVIWATGYRPDFRWLRLPVLDAAGRPRHRRGVSEVPGLYFLGLPWLHTRGSALLGGVGRDAAHLADVIVRRARDLSAEGQGSAEIDAA